MKIKKYLLIITILLSFSISKEMVYADNNFEYSDAIVDNLASVIASETGCGQRSYFVYQLIWGAVYMNNYNRIVGLDTPITLNSMCITFSDKNLYTSLYCYYDFDKLTAARGSCTESQIAQLRLAAKLVLAKSFNIPKNIYMAAESSVVELYGIAWDYFTPTGGWTTYYAYQNNEALSTKDIYGNTVNTDTTFYHNLADCLYENNIYNAYNKCPSEEETSDTGENDNETSEEQEFTIKLYYNDETDYIYDTQIIKEGELIGKPVDPERNGYTFKEWQTKEGKTYDFNSKVTTDTNLYAKWILTTSTQNNEKNETTTKTEEHQSGNPQTGSIGLIIIFIMTICSFFAIAHYYKYFSINKE